MEAERETLEAILGRLDEYTAKCCCRVHPSSSRALCRVQNERAKIIERQAHLTRMEQFGEQRLSKLSECKQAVPTSLCDCSMR